MAQNDKKGHPTTAVLLALCLLIAASFVKWCDITGGAMHDFNLLADIMVEHPDSASDDAAEDPSAPIDPVLADMMKKTATANDSISSISASDSTDVVPDPLPEIIVARRDSNGPVAIEDYTVGQRGLQRLSASLAAGRKARIAVVGDSYIEGDIFTQDLRAMLQEEYGGSGVGYMGLHSDFPGFRQSVRQSGSGWTVHEAGKKGARSCYEGLSEKYYTVSGNAKAVYKGTEKIDNADTWNRARFLFCAPGGGTVTMSGDNGTIEHQAIASADSVQCMDYTGLQTSVTLTTSSPSVTALGIWLESGNGIGVDCMSSRGYSGLTLSGIDVDLCRQMSKFINYDLIILEFGINAMSPGQKNFTVYCNALVGVINHLRECYPDAEFLVMGIGDRGEKRNGTVRSMGSVSYMIEAQRTAARTARCLFWDTREAMGGNDAIVEWTRNGWANKDYIHMTHKGGSRLAKEFYAAFNQLMR